MRRFEYIIIVGWVFGRRAKCSTVIEAVNEAEARRKLWQGFEIAKDKIVSWKEVE